MTSAFPGNPQRRPPEQVTPFAERSEQQKAARRRQAEYLASINLSSGERGYELRTLPRPTGRSTRAIITEYDLPKALDGSSRCRGGSRRDGLVRGLRPAIPRQARPRDRRGHRVRGARGEARKSDRHPRGETRPGTAILGAATCSRDRSSGSTGRPRSSRSGRFRTSWSSRPARMGRGSSRSITRRPRAPTWTGKCGFRTGRLPVLTVWTWPRASSSPSSPSATRIGTRTTSTGSSRTRRTTSGSWDFSNEHVGRIDARTGEIALYETPTLGSRPRRGEVDSEDRLWYAGFGAGVVGMFDPDTEEFREWFPPTPYTKPYDVHVDRNGHVWTGSMYTDRVVRLDPETGEFIEYLLPEMGVNIRRVYVDDSTDPVTFWIGSNHGASIISLQVLDT